MIFDFSERTERIIGENGQKRLAEAKVAIFGLGGVGSYIAEALARAGIGELHLIDGDRVDVSNINRQLYALHSTINEQKTSVAAKRIKDINPNVRVFEYPLFFTETTRDEIDFEHFDYIADAIDMVPSKILLYKIAQEKNIPVIGSMGTGNKTDPTKFAIADIYKTSVCPLAKAVRTLCRKEGIEKLKVLYSTEPPNENSDKAVIGSISFVPSAAGLIIAAELIKDLLN